jgi:hypothetical protein
MKQVSIKIDDNLHAALVDDARRAGRSLVKQMAWILADHVINHPTQEIVIPSTERQAS